MTRPMRGAALALLAALAACLPISETDYGELRVRVIDQFGQPIEDARVEPFGGWYWSSPRAIAHTGADGTVRMQLPPAQYQVDVYPPNWDDWRPFVQTDTIIIESGADSVVFQFNREPGTFSRENPRR